MSRRSRKRRKKAETGYKDVELNIMPFIDVFSILTTFLLMTAVFSAVGIHEVQVPFFSNAPEEENENKPDRSLQVNVEVEVEKLFVKAKWSPDNTQELDREYVFNEQGIQEMHTDLVELRMKQPETDFVTLYSEDDVIFEKLSLVLDAVKLRGETDPVIPPANQDPTKILTEKQQREASAMLFPKVIFGSVIL